MSCTRVGVERLLGDKFDPPVSVPTSLIFLIFRNLFGDPRDFFN